MIAQNVELRLFVKKINFKIYCMKKILLISCLALVLSSCTSCTSFDREEHALTLVFDQPLVEGKYPSYFKGFSQPLSLESCEKDILFKPIYYVRADISRTEKESNAWYFKDIGENTVEFSTNFLKQYFSDSLVPNYLTKESKGKQVTINSYIKKKDDAVVIFSEESPLDEMEGVPILHTTREVSDKMKELSCNNPQKKITLLINPKELLIEEPLPPGIPGSDGSEPPIDVPCSMNTVADGLDLKYDLLKVIDTSLSPLERDKLAKQVWTNYFDENAAIKMYLSSSQKFPEGFWESGKGSSYIINRLAYVGSITDLNIARIEYHRESKKISGLTIFECHNASEIQ